MWWGQVWWAGTHLWPGVAGDQAGELQGLSLADGVDPLGVALLLDVAGQARVHDPHRGGSCKASRETGSEPHRSRDHESWKGLPRIASLRESNPTMELSAQ